MTEPRWIAAREVVVLARSLVRDSGEPFGIRDVGLIESALAVPRNAWAYEGQNDLHLLALLHMVALARSHPFVQGNKRAGFSTMLLFLVRNQLSIKLVDHESYAEALIGMLAEKSDEAVELFLSTFGTTLRSQTLISP